MEDSKIESKAKRLGAVHLTTQLLDETLDLVCKLEDILNRLKVTDPRDQESIAKVHTKLVRNHRLKLLIKEITS